MSFNFASDNVAGASRPVLDALVAANAGPMPAYGTDPITLRAIGRLAELFEREVEALLVATGTAANALALAACVDPWGLCVCHEEAHVIDDECGAPEFFAHGAKLMGLPGTGGKLDPDRLAAALDRLPRHEKQMPAQVVSLSQATECGLVYTADEIAALAAVAHARGLHVHMDGARFANALLHLGCSPADLTWRVGIDILSFGATKNGCFAAEAVIAFRPELARSLRFRRKRSGHTLSKGRLLGAQFDGYLKDDHWLENAGHANAAAARLSAGLAAVPGIRIAWPTQANEVFAVLPAGLDAALKAAGAVYHPWSPRSLPEDAPLRPGETLVRLVCSFATDPSDVEGVIAAARAAIA